MPSYNAPVRDMQFLLHEVLGFEDLLKYDAYSEIDADLASAVLEQGAKFAEEVLAPLNIIGDHEGCKRHDDGSVTCLLYTSPSPRDKRQSRMPSSA